MASLRLPIAEVDFGRVIMCKVYELNSISISMSMSRMRRNDVENIHMTNSRRSHRASARRWSPLRHCATLATILTALLVVGQLVECAQVRDYHYTRTRKHPNHLRISEDLKNNYVDEIQFESKINGTKFEYYRSTLAMNYDELVFETIDKIYRHRLSPFYIHHYDKDHDKKQSADPRRVSQEACARDLLYLVDKMPLKHKQQHFNQQQQQQTPAAEFLMSDPSSDFFPAQLEEDNEHLSPELSAFFDSYAHQESGLLMGNTFWVGAYDQCVKRQIFELVDTSQQPARHQTSRRTSKTTTTTTTTAGESETQFARDEHQQAVAFNGRYCVASLAAPSWPALIEAKKLKAKNYFKTERQLRVYTDLFRLQLGVCLPDSCDSTALERHRDEIKLLASLNLAHSRFSSYNLIDLYCLPDEQSALRQWSSSALNFIAFLTLWLTLVLAATLADVFELFPMPLERIAADAEKQQQLQASAPAEAAGEGPRKRARASRLPRLVQCLSLRANYRKLMHVSGEPANPKREVNSSAELAAQSRPTAPVNTSQKQQVSLAAQEQHHAHNVDGQQQHKIQQQQLQQQQHQPQQQQEQLREPNLRFLNAFKVLIMFWIINGHIMLLMIQTAKNILNSDALLNELMHFLIGATFGVDLFFTMTGFLTSYLIFKGGHAYRMKATTWIYLSFHRYWRLAPMYLLSFWFSRSVMQSLGSGPLWDYGTSSITFRGLCNTESWWFPLTLTSNLHGLFEECMITSWYISCDMQFWLVSPIFIHLLAKSPLQGWLVSLLTIAASSKARYDAILNDKSARYDELVQPRADIFMRVSHDLPALYTHPQFRISAYIVGLLAGHYVYMATGGQSKRRAECAEGQKAMVQEANGACKANGALRANGALNARSTSANGTAPVDKMHAELKGGKTRISHHEPVLAPLEGRMRSICAYAGLFIFLTMAFVSYLLAHYYPSSWLRYARPMAAAAYSVDHLVMAIGASLMIVTICQGQWPWLARFLSHPNWTRLSKLNYALLLLQCEAIYYQIFRYEQVPLAGTRELINILFNLLVTLYPLAFAATLVFEFPLANLEKLL